MKILMVNKFLYHNGGSETYMFKLSEYLISQGHTVEFFGMDSENRCVSNRAESYTDNVDFHNTGKLGQIALSMKTIYSKQARQKIARVLETFKPDIVHLNNINFQLTPSIIYEIRKHNIPMVQTVHDVQMACPNHSMYIESEGKACSECLDGKYLHCVKNKCLHNSYLKSVIAATESYLYHKKGTYNLIDKFICPSNAISDIIVNAGIERKKIKVLSNFCEKTNISEYKNNNTEKYALYFGRIDAIKGIKTLADVCKELPEIKFIFAGTGPLEDYCKGIKNIELAGFKSGKELKSLIVNAAFSICPSECFENCPMSVIESKALGTAVIGSNMGGIPELIENGKTGFVFEAGNKNALKKAITKLYYNDNLISEMGKNCVEASSNTIEKYGKKVLEIYSNLISEM